MNRRSLDYQALAREFGVGDVVYVVRTPDMSGRVSAVYQGIGQVDVEFPTGTTRYPVEDLMRMESNTVINPPEVVASAKASPGRVATAFIKKGIYWAAVDRKYRATKEEQDNKRYTCPKCASPLKAMVYKREEGRSQRLYGCSGASCGFLVKPSAIAGCHLSVEEGV